MPVRDLQLSAHNILPSLKRKGSERMNISAAFGSQLGLNSLITIISKNSKNPNETIQMCGKCWSARISQHAKAGGKKIIIQQSQPCISILCIYHYKLTTKQAKSTLFTNNNEA